MKKTFKKLKRCRSCKSSNLSKVLSNVATPLGDSFLDKKDYRAISNKKYLINLMICIKCKLAQLNIVINQKLINRRDLSTGQSNLGLLNHFKNSFSEIVVKLNLNKKAKIMEIMKSSDSSHVSLLSIFKKKGFKTLAIKPKEKQINSKSKYLINNNLNKDLAQGIKKNYGFCDLIISNNVFANIDNINSHLVNIKSLLSNNGSYIFESSYLLDLVKNQVIDFIYHEHLSYFSVLAVFNLCKKHELVLFDCTNISSKGGSIRYYISKNKNKKVSKNVFKAIAKEKEFKLYNKKSYNKLKFNLKYTKKKLNNFINTHKKFDFIGFGASISCITLLYQLKLENKIKALIDDNKAKENKFSPGSLIKVFDPKKIIISKKNIVLIFPWRFQKHILKKYKVLFKKANKIIQIWPSFKELKI